MNKDIVWIDYAKVIGIWLVILGHSIQWMPGWENSFMHTFWNWLYLFHMPLFFIISGYLFYGKRTKLSRFSRGGVKIWESLIIPYLIYQITFFPYAIWVHRENLFANGEWWKLLVGILDGDGYNTPISLYICLPCWFIVCIIQLRIIFLFVHINKLSATILTILSVLFLMIRKHFGFDLFFCIDSTIMAIPYFIFGYYMRKNEIFDKIKRQSTWWEILFVSAIIVSLVLIFNGPAQMIGPSYGYNLFANYIAGIAGSFLVFSLSHLLEYRLGDKKDVKIVSRNTLFLIFGHFVIIHPSGLVLAKVIKTINYNSVISIMGALILSVLVLLISKKWIEMWIEKYPIVFGKCKTNIK